MDCASAERILFKIDSRLETSCHPDHFGIKNVYCGNPCPCGYYGDPIKECTCTPTQIARYQKRISGPLLDRIDIHIQVPRVEYDKLTGERLDESSKQIRA